MTERALWRHLKSRLTTAPQFTSRIDALDVPDVVYCLDGDVGWIELKQIDRWPVRSSTPVRVRHFTVGQRLWLRQWARGGGRCFVLLRVGEMRREYEYLLLDGAWAADHLGLVPKATLIDDCLGCWHGVIDAEHLVELLRE